MKDLKSFVERMGALHDAVVRQLIWIPGAKILRIEIEDFCSNFEGLPEYPGAVSGSIELQGIEQIDFDLHTAENRLNIDEFIVESGIDKHRASVSFWLTGRMTVLYRVADFPDINLNQRPGT
jgi:hypothetical protein